MIEFSSGKVTGSSWDAYGLAFLLLIFALLSSGYVLRHGIAQKGKITFELLLRCVLIITSVIPAELPMQAAMAVNSALLNLVKLSVFVDICLFDKTGTHTTDQLTAVGVVCKDTTVSTYAVPKYKVLGHVPMIAANLDATLVLVGCQSLVQIDGKMVGDPVEEVSIRAIDFSYDAATRQCRPNKDLERARERRWGQAINQKDISVQILHRHHFSSKLERMSVVAKVHLGSKGMCVRSLVKGSPEAVATLLVPESIPESYWPTYQSLAHRGMRVLALAYNDIHGRPYEAEVAQHPRAWAESNLQFAGFAVFQCLVRKDSGDVLKVLKDSPHLVSMITGDATLTAIHVSKENASSSDRLKWTHAADDSVLAPYKSGDINVLVKKYDLCVNRKTLLAAGEVDDMIWKNLNHIRVFARMTPELKEKVLTLLKTHGHHTLMCGGGGNDVGALKQAHIGNSQALRAYLVASTNGDCEPNRFAIVAGAAALAGTSSLAMNATQSEEVPDKEMAKFEFEEAVDIIRRQVSEFRATLKSSETRIPKAFPIKKIGISKIHAPNGVATIRIEFACPPFVDQEAILGRLLLQLKGASASPGNRPAVEVLPVPIDVIKKKSAVESYEQPAVTYLYSNGSGSFHFLRDTSSQQAKSKFVFYKDDFLTQSEIDAIVSAYKEIYSYANVNAFFRHNLEMRRRNAFGRGRNPTGADALDSKAEAVQQLQSLGIDVFEPLQKDNTLNWDSLAGYEDVKTEIEDTVVLALQNPELYERIAEKTRCRYESNRPRAVLFEGPPGTGKTLSARIIAQQAGIPMVHIPIESVVSKWYGDSEKKMSAIFDACEKLDGATIFIDEIDALAGDRSGGAMHEASRRILSVLLQKVEGFASAKKTTVICATNRKQDLDAALISRFDLSIRYNLPDEKTRHAVFARYAKQLSDEELSQLAAISPQLSCRDIKEAR
ncbi:hypothetical protein PsorP6_003878 [Peronosclerospora sorghi]|uniref:Uncharacterized protein n=1 Tax=Peronosclerospora sorghi TaxID=230839 RepID=A0ACC0VNL8_9STRA|nr:hypothetical protein PsorP6_003878 [Peronosclerospora sorghi]